MGRIKKGIDINGWLVIDKPRDMGSTDVVTRLKRMFNANKVGHTGTLDPFATGVLPIAFGEATKLVNMVMDGRKEYEFVLQFGFESTTDDSEGVITPFQVHTPTRVAVRQQVGGNSSFPIEGKVNKDDILRVISSFIGRITQVPPVYSAIKVDGKRAYDLARAGVEVEMKPREIEVYDLELLEMMEGDCARFRVECSKGTYVRTLGKDIAIALGTKGYLRELRRTLCGVFGVQSAIKLETLEKMVYEETQLLPIEACLRDIAVIAVGEVDAAKLKLGQSVSPKDYGNIEGEAVAMFENKLVAIVRIDERRMAPVRVFNL